MASEVKQRDLWLVAIAGLFWLLAAAGAAAQPLVTEQLIGPPVRAIVIDAGGVTDRWPVAFTEIRERRTTIDGHQVRLVCAIDGIAEVLVEILAEGKWYVASTSRNDRFRIVFHSAHIRPLNSERSDRTLWFAANWETMRDNVKGLCPAAWGAPPGEYARHKVEAALQRGEENYRRNAVRLGLEPR